MTDADLLAAVCAKEPPVKQEADPAPSGPAYGYIRVSTEDQAESGLGLEAQSEAITRYCHLKKLRLFRVFADEAKSGRTTYCKQTSRR
jgi:hypothetical protein